MTVPKLTPKQLECLRILTDVNADGIDSTRFGRTLRELGDMGLVGSGVTGVQTADGILRVRGWGATSAGIAALRGRVTAR